MAGLRAMLRLRSSAKEIRINWLTIGDEPVREKRNNKRKRKNMKMSELVQEVQAELDAETQAIAKEVLRERLQEVADTKRALARMEAQLNDLLAQDVNDIANAGF